MSKRGAYILVVDDEVEKAHNLHVYVAQLRRKIEPFPQQPQFILTVPGVGYRFPNEAEQ